MAESRLDVNDAELRDGFLRHQAQAALAGLRDETPARWGGMTAQQMVEHLIWSVELSTGDARTECPIPEAERPAMKAFLYRNLATPHEFMNPVLVSGLPPLRYANLAQAKSVLGERLLRFLDQSPGATDLHTHPIFGSIGHEDWHRAHYKHVHHHLSQFGLIGADDPSGGPDRRS